MLVFDKIIIDMAKECVKLGIEPNVESNSELANWVRQNCDYRPDTEFFIVFLTACEMGKLCKNNLSTSS